MGVKEERYKQLIRVHELRYKLEQSAPEDKQTHRAQRDALLNNLLSQFPEKNRGDIEQAIITDYSKFRRKQERHSEEKARKDYQG